MILCSSEQQTANIILQHTVKPSKDSVSVKSENYAHPGNTVTCYYGDWGITYGAKTSSVI